MNGRSYLVTYGEVALKGRNQRFFIEQLCWNLKAALSPLGRSSVKRTQGRLILVTGIPDRLLQPALAKVFGVASVFAIQTTGLSLAAIESSVVQCVAKALGEQPTATNFKIIARRINKSYPLRSMDLNCRLGQVVLENFPNLKVRVKQPDLPVHVEIRDRECLLYTAKIPGPGGLPVGVSGKGLLLLSGGIDSPVAGWQLLKRGMRVVPVHFQSPPFTSVRATEKVLDLARLLTKWGGEPRAHLVNFKEIQLKIRKQSPPELGTLLGRKAMMQIASMLCVRDRYQALITGENLGQVASQTVESLTATGFGIPFPVFRPLIGWDKREIMDAALRIGTYAVSIEPFEDCCTLFLTEKPRTKPGLEEMDHAYRNLELDSLIQECLDGMETVSLDREPGDRRSSTSE